MMKKYDIITQILWKAGISIKIKEDSNMGFEKNFMEKREEERLNTDKKSDKMKKIKREIGKKIDSLKTTIKSIFGYYYD